MYFLDNSKLDFRPRTQTCQPTGRLAFLRQAQTWVLSQSQRSKSSLRIVTQKSIRPFSLAGKIENQPFTRKIPNFGLSQNLG